MHAERDMLVWRVFPELRRRAASHCLYLQEVELRWGVTEEESVRTTELCLSEVRLGAPQTCPPRPAAVQLGK
uniref:Uncharacterized protein n=1 Tax=Monopterus albus TaxID=43700 RepID=A0A3Q3J7T6_MONAL